MCTIDWAATGTWAAVVVALAIAVAGGLRRRRVELVQGHLLAITLYVELQECVASAHRLAEYINEQRTGGILAPLMEKSEHLREQIGRYCLAFPTAELDSAVPRLHVLPLSCARALMAMRATISVVRMYGNSFHALSDANTTADYDGIAASLQALAHDLVVNSEAAAAATDKVGKTPPRWWHAIVGR